MASLTRRCPSVLLIVLSLVASSLLPSGQAGEVPKRVETIFWEEQGWGPAPGGGAVRVTLWADGRWDIAPKGPLATGRNWTGATAPRWSDAIDRKSKGNPQLREAAKRAFEAALSAGIDRLKSFPIRYCDGGGTLVGIKVNGQTKETLIPLFLEEHENEKGSENHKRFLAVKKPISEFYEAVVQVIMKFEPDGKKGGLGLLDDERRPATRKAQVPREK